MTEAKFDYIVDPNAAESLTFDFESQRFTHVLPTLQAAVDAAQRGGGGTILLKRGVYDQPIEIPGTTEGIEIIGEEEDRK